MPCTSGTYLCGLVKKNVNFVAQELEESDESAVVHIPSRAEFQVFLSSEVNVAKHQCQAAGPRLQPVGLGRGTRRDRQLREDSNYAPLSQKETFQEN